MMPRFFRIAAAASLAVCFLALPAAASAPHPSLVLVTIDTLRADRLGCYGYPRETSPNLDSLAEQAILFERVYTTMATTLPAHASLMTGTYPLTHRVQANVAFIPRSLDDATDLRTLAELLRRAGYETAAFVSAAPLKRHSGIDRGFETFSQPKLWQRGADKTTEHVLEWLNERTEKPFFLWVHYFDPHWPYSPPLEYVDRLGDFPELADYLQELGVSDPRSHKLLKVNDAYDAEVLYTDDAVGRLFGRLRELRLWDASVVVVASDHGEGLGQHGYLYHGRIYDEQLHVPLLIKLPGMHESRRIRHVTSLVDVLPVLSAATELPIQAAEPQFQGRNALDPREDCCQAFSERVHRESRAWGPGRRYALTRADWKYFHSTEEGDALYDLRDDPHETQNVIGDHPEVVKELASELGAWIRECSREPAGEVPEIDRETLEQLRALGYVDGP